MRGRRTKKKLKKDNNNNNNENNNNTNNNNSNNNNNNNLNSNNQFNNNNNNKKSINFINKKEKLKLIEIIEKSNEPINNILSLGQAKYLMINQSELYFRKVGKNDDKYKDKLMQNTIILKAIFSNNKIIFIEQHNDNNGGKECYLRVIAEINNQPQSFSCKINNEPYDVKKILIILLLLVIISLKYIVLIKIIMAK